MFCLRLRLNSLKMILTPQKLNLRGHVKKKKSKNLFEEKKN